MKERSLIGAIIEFVFGIKYYANIINTKGTAKSELCSFIFTSKEAAAKHRQDIEGTLSFRFIETISFRSRHDYTNLNQKQG